MENWPAARIISHGQPCSSLLKREQLHNWHLGHLDLPVDGGTASR
jgi:hypothetical protein